MHFLFIYVLISLLRDKKIREFVSHIVVWYSVVLPNPNQIDYTDRIYEPNLDEADTEGEMYTEIRIGLGS